MKYDEFLAWADEDTHAEWVDSAVIFKGPLSLRGHMLRSFLMRVLSEFTEEYGLGTIIGNFHMRLDHSGREPELIFVASDHTARLTEVYLDGPADLVVEVISPESGARDRGEKFYEYEAAGIPEYWLLDPEAERAEFYQLDEHGKYQQIAPDPQHVYHSRALPGFWLKTDWLWQGLLPGVEETLLAVGGEPYARALLERLREGGYLPGR